MKKDIIYIDTEDDITAIIGKIKASKDQVIALVPPKRTGLLQSAVNLRLLGRIAEKEEKRLVIVTNNKALVALTAAAKIPVAKNLQSKPEIAEIAALEVDDGEDIIDGAQLPIGELAKTADRAKDDNIEDDISTLDIDNEGPQFVPVSVSNPTNARVSKSPANKAKDGTKVPDFSKFRKKLFIGIAAGVLFIVFLIWAIWFAPAAKVIINAKTTEMPISTTVKLGGTSVTDASKNTIQTITKQLKKDMSVDFAATGTKDIGTKASGEITLHIDAVLPPISVPAGTEVVSGGKSYFTKNTIVITTSGVTGSGTGEIIAEANGADYNLPNSSDFTVTGFSLIYGESGAITGGSSKVITIVTAADVQKAGQALVDLPTNEYKQQLIKQFTNGEKVIDDSFSIDRAAAVSSPVVGAEATNSKATLTSSTTFSITAIAKNELKTFLKSELKKQIDDEKKQKIYNDGVDDVKIDGYLVTDKVATANLSTVGQIGPDINEDTIKNIVKGKRFGDVQSTLEAINGVDSVDVKFSYFWVWTVPDDVNKIDVEFVLKND